MTKEGEVQPTLLDLDTELSVNLRTGRVRLGRRRATKGYPEERRKAAMAFWQTSLPEVLALAAGGWRELRGAQQAETLGINVEYDGITGRASDTENTLVAKFKQAHGLHLTALNVALVVYWKVADMRERLGGQADWLPAFFDWTLGKLCGVYNLNQQNTADLQRLVPQRHLPGFTRIT